MEKTGTASPHAHAAREAKRRDALAMGIDERFVAELVDRFYARIRGDDLIGPIFAARISDWGPHLDQMKRFWRSILFSSGEYLGNPMIKHLAIDTLDRAMFARWLDLFDATLHELGSDQAREHVHARARMIANSLLNGIAVHRDRRLGIAPEEAFSETPASGS
ncbi:group III truncated hemoglobin [Sphingomonas gei]|uniref:Group III truncated hemoglobin n=1 Tax=Sphingomonas gei TaxID=1395960 RepID=A0A4S1XIB5_9SPHN|nr:group III truncated hemoglobin [Sphingomonas gei]TGX55727.1 group III truncated hemoglobin [Sphingomonas gei]